MKSEAAVKTRVVSDNADASWARVHRPMWADREDAFAKSEAEIAHLVARNAALVAALEAAFKRAKQLQVTLDRMGIPAGYLLTLEDIRDELTAALQSTEAEAGKESNG